MEPIIEFEHVDVSFPMRAGTVQAVRDVSLRIPRGKITALVGESGSGKSTLASTLLRMVSAPGIISADSIEVDGQDVMKMSEKKLRNYRWSQVSMVFQAAQNSLNPVVTIGEQFIETYRAHQKEAKKVEIEKRAIELLEYVKLEPKRILRSFPHELSGGMKQRVMIAFSLLLEPKIVILDEPTTALDVITQDYIFSILEKINKELGVTLLLLSHDIAVVAKVADYLGVMYAGKVVEFNDIHTIFEAPKHPYTIGLLQAVPSLIHDLEEIKPIPGASPNLLELPKGCPFHPRCEHVMSQCKTVEPELLRLQAGYRPACHLFDPEQKEVTTPK
ncbi:peptide/nickel transport system ATP-binding protein [Lederbergia galactosidilyticus]|uniref:ABC transporter ATP-binding protein n=1 Tax=Lederbergia galactosidilytica TaxID=217031 RepID=UPI001AE5F779|nr:ABC transporter ATP-binding protein [Lederbergia galactosidilytica]MBP1916719.1 peptide/nickel transport system ATP-binding protein [Lederbergia galactosidilytica]